MFLSHIRQLTADSKRLRIFLILCLSTAFNFALIGGRLWYLGIDLTEIATTQDYYKLRGSTTFLFLVWNLFLAWIPYWIAISLESIHQWFGKGMLSFLALLAWLFFFPNAPYILTDLLHLRSRAPIPHWYDLMLIASCAWTGLMLGLLSLYEVQVFLRRRFSAGFSWVAVSLFIMACGYGIYLGRYLRWNSWDVLAQPLSLFHDIWQSFLDPVLFRHSMQVSLVLSGFLMLAYLMMHGMMAKDR
ncbi:MAG: DUF1361 domain-containing protein [Bacteroidota bacterium]